MSAPPNPVDYVIAIPTFIGSLLSFLGSATALVFQIIRPPRKHFRHALIVNLLVADMIYGLCNTISGAVFITSGKTPHPTSPPDAICRVSGFFSQANAQAVDFNILIIAIVVLLSVVKKDAIAHLDNKWQILICIAAWVPGWITGTIGLALNSYGYVSGNWCWIRGNRLDLRYGLSHGWRIGIFFITIVIYTYIYLSLKAVFRSIRSISAVSNGTHTRTLQRDNQNTVPSDSDGDTQKILVAQTVTVSHEMQTLPPTPTDSKEGNYPSGNTTQSVVRIEGTTTGGDVRPFDSSRLPAAPNIKKMLLMNGYPLAYIILWIPGIANRLVESVNGVSPRWLTALQACTQYIGLINAVTYGLTEQTRRGVWRRIKDTGGFGRSS